MKPDPDNGTHGGWPAGLSQAVEETKHRIAVALGEIPPDLVLKGGQVVDVYRERLWEADIAIAARRIAAVRPNVDSQGAPELDCRGLIAGPGFVEPHMHIETTFVTPRQLARAIVPRGTTTLFADGTDASYVSGLASVDALFASTRGLPIRVFLEAPSYSALLPDLQTVGGLIDLAASQEMLTWPQTVSLGEVVAAEVVARKSEYLAKICAYRQAAKRINGHSMNSDPSFLDAFVSAGGIDDHTTDSGEGLEARLARGMTLFLVEAPGRRHLSKMLQYVVNQRLPTRSLCLCIDNTSILDIVRDDYGYLDYPVSLAVAASIAPVEAIQMASLNPAAYFGRDADFGSIAPGRFADIQLWDNLTHFRPRRVLFEGQVVAEDGRMTLEPARSEFPAWYLNTIRIDPAFSADSLLPVPPVAGSAWVRVMQLDGPRAQAANRETSAVLPVRNGKVWPDTEQDVISFCVVERYGHNGNIGYGYLAGSGLQRGALATSVSIADSNIVVLGCDPTSMWTAIQAVAGMQGGFAVALDDQVLASMPAPVGGQMSDAPFEDVVAGFANLGRVARDLGCILANPFLTMASTVLMSVPDLGLSDCGYIDARRVVNVSTFVE
jgi:adenine deaminase